LEHTRANEEGCELGAKVFEASASAKEAQSTLMSTAARSSLHSRAHSRQIQPDDYLKTCPALLSLKFYRQPVTDWIVAKRCDFATYSTTEILKKTAETRERLTTVENTEKGHRGLSGLITG
jgi:hypothetical protein